MRLSNDVPRRTVIVHGKTREPDSREELTHSVQTAATRNVEMLTGDVPPTEGALINAVQINVEPTEDELIRDEPTGAVQINAGPTGDELIRDELINAVQINVEQTEGEPISEEPTDAAQTSAGSTGEEPIRDGPTDAVQINAGLTEGKQTDVETNVSNDGAARRSGNSVGSTDSEQIVARVRDAGMPDGDISASIAGSSEDSKGKDTTPINVVIVSGRIATTVTGGRSDVRTG